MTYQAATEWLFGQLPMFQRQGPAAYKANLEGTWYVLEKLGRPDLHLENVIHVAGTNGKGSVCTAISHALTETGFRVGLFTSPHLVDFRERMRVCGETPSEEWVVLFIERLQDEIPSWSYLPSFFELTFGMALMWFVEQQTDVVVLETGMGGRLDSTNIFPRPLVTAITNIGLDHQEFLGSDIRAIAKEKAGILKDGVPVVLGRMRPEAQSVILAHALRTVSEMHYAEPALSLSSDEGPFWGENQATASKVLEVLQNQLGWREWSPPKQADLHRTGHLGRWNWLKPAASGARVLVDCAHNADGLSRTMQAIQTEPADQVHVVLGVVADKSLDFLWDILLQDAMYYWCAADIPRALPSSELQIQAGERGFIGRTCDSVLEAFHQAKSAAGQRDLVVVIGSIFVAAEVLAADQ